MRSLSRNRSKSRDSRERNRTERGRTRERNSSKDRSKSNTDCKSCKCEDCEKLRKFAKELKINWCQNITVNEEILVNFTERGKQVLILDLGAPVSVAGTEWMNQYLKDHNLKVEDLKGYNCHQIFKFGPSKQYISKRMVDLPIIVRTLDGKEDVLQVFTYLVDADIPFLCGKSELKDKWKSKIDTENNVFETKLHGRRRDFRIVGTSGNHVALELEKVDLKEEQILFTTEDEDVNDYKAIRKVHEVNNHKSADQLIIHYRRVNLIGPETTKLIKQVVKDCKICQKFSKSLAKPKIALPIASSFNEIVTLDLKQFGDK